MPFLTISERNYVAQATLKLEKVVMQYPATVELYKERLSLRMEVEMISIAHAEHQLLESDQAVFEKANNILAHHK